MDIKRLSDAYDVRRLTAADADAVFALCRPNELFYRYNPPAASRESILRDMEALPPGKSADDKYYIGFFEGEALVAVMDFINGYPAAGTAFIGFFMMDVRYQNRGIGTSIIGGCKAALREYGFAKIRLGVDKGNPQSYAFWKKNGFEVVGEGDYIVMEFELA